MSAWKVTRRLDNSWTSENTNPEDGSRMVTTWRPGARANSNPVMTSFEVRDSQGRLLGSAHEGSRRVRRGARTSQRKGWWLRDADGRETNTFAFTTGEALTAIYRWFKQEEGYER